MIAAARGLAAFKVDLTNYKSESSEALRRRYAIGGVPTVVFLTPDGSEVRDARVEGFVPPAEFLARLARAHAGGARAAN